MRHCRIATLILLNGPPGVDAAIGLLTHITPLGIAGTTLERAIEMAREAALSLSPQLGA